MKAPNFLIIGAARSGSTSLACSLALHPDLFLPRADSEPKFFSREQEYVKGIDYYLGKYFPSTDTDRYVAVGEKSTEYMENRSAARRIYQFNPLMKLVCILRDPVERAISNYWWSVQNRVEDRPINEALVEEWKNYINNPSVITALFSSRPRAYIDRSLYYDNLRPFYELFPGNVKCVVFEDFVVRMEQIVHDVWLFLNLDPKDLLFGRQAQRAVGRKKVLDPRIYDELKSFFFEKNDRLAELVGVDIWKLWGQPH